MGLKEKKKRGELEKVLDVFLPTHLKRGVGVSPYVRGCPVRFSSFFLLFLKSLVSGGRHHLFSTVCDGNVIGSFCNRNSQSLLNDFSTPFCHWVKNNKRRALIFTAQQGIIRLCNFSVFVLTS